MTGWRGVAPILAAEAAAADRLTAQVRYMGTIGGKCPKRRVRAKRHCRVLMQCLDASLHLAGADWAPAPGSRGRDYYEYPPT